MPRLSCDKPCVKKFFWDLFKVIHKLKIAKSITSTPLRFMFDAFSFQFLLQGFQVKSV